MGRTSDAKEHLMDAALELIWEESYGAVSIDDICKRADVKKGSFYYFFKSKADLAVAAMDRLWERDWKPRLDQMFSSSVEPLERLTTYLGGMYPLLLEQKKEHGKVLGCPICNVGSEISTQEVDVNAEARKLLGRKRRYYESAIRDAIAEGSIEPCDPSEKAVALLGLIDGIVAQARIMDDPEVARKITSMALSLFTLKRPLAVPAAT